MFFGTPGYTERGTCTSGLALVTRWMCVGQSVIARTCAVPGEFVVDLHWFLSVQSACSASFTVRHCVTTSSEAALHSSG